MIKGINSYILLVILVITATACGRNVLFTDSFTMKGKVWKLNDAPVFYIPVKDTVNKNNILFLIRTGSSYPYRNIFLFVTTTAPDGTRLTDTLQYELADEKGNWYGKGFGDIHELKLPFKTNVFFPHPGTYQVAIQHGMRIGDLKGIYDFGLRVERTPK